MKNLRPQDFLNFFEQIKVMDHSKLDELIQSNRKKSLEFINSKYVKYIQHDDLTILYCDQCENIVAHTNDSDSSIYGKCVYCELSCCEPCSLKKNDMMFTCGNCQEMCCTNCRPDEYNGLCVYCHETAGCG